MPSRRSALATQFRGFAFLIMLFCGCSLLQAQINTGRLTGIVRDSSGSVVTDARVVATNDGTGAGTPGATSDVGEYFINFLTPGTYHLSVEKAGFQRELLSNVIVNAGGIARFDFTLKPGQVVETLEVAADSLQVATETSELSQTFSNKELDRLPNLDRNPLYQVNLMPGSNNATGSGNYGQNGGENGSAIGQTRNQLSSLGGVDANANSIFIEGVANREPQNAYVGQAPPIDSIQELQVYTGKYNAEFGFSGSAVINVVTKSGTNQFHGSAFEYLRNNATDALPHDIPGHEKQTLNPFHRNQFGGSFGGPVIKTKLFFFGDYQETRLNTSSIGTDTAPTPKMQQGDFSELFDNPDAACTWTGVSSPVDDAGNKCGQLYWPGSQVRDNAGNVISATPIPGNIIPSTYWDPAATQINSAALWGTANRSGIVNNLAFSVGNVQRVRQTDERVDWNHKESDHYFFRYSALRASLNDINNINNGNPITGNTQFWNNGQANSKSFNQNMQVTNQHSFSPVTMNEVRFGYNRTAVHTGNASMAKDWNNFFGIPNGNLGDLGTRGMADFGPGWCCNGVNPLHTFGDPDWVGYVISNTFSGVDNFTIVKDRHTIKFGTMVNHVESSSADTIGGDNPRGSLFFDPAMTSYDGTSNGYAYAAFLLGFDTSAARAHFVTGTPYQTFWQMAWYGQDDFKVTPTLTLNLGLRYELSSRPVDVSNRQANWDTRNNQLVVASPSNRSPALGLDKGDIGPRLGFAWSPDQGKTSLRGGYGISYWQTYWSGPVTILGLGYPFYAKQDLISTNNITPDLSLSGNPGLTPAVAAGSLGYSMVPFTNAGLPVASAVYDSSGKLVIPANATIRATDYFWKNQRVDQASLNLERQIRPGLIADIGYLRVLGKNGNLGKNINQAPPNPSVLDNQTVNRPLYSQYPQLGDLQAQFSIGTSWYNAFTARVQGKVSKLVTINLNYAYGRTFANGNNPSWLLNDVNYKRGPAPQDIEHTFNGQFVFDVPVGRGKMYGANMNKIEDAVIGGWQYSGYLRWNSGPRFTVTQSCSFYNNGSGPLPDRVGNGNLTRGNRTLAQWFDVNAFQVHGCDPVNHPEQLGTDGNEGTNPLFADGQVQLDSSLSKYFKLNERFNLEFRADAFNTLNHTNWGIPDSNVQDGSLFGTIQSASTTNRQMQFGLHLTF